jgi:hypothetical protein
MGFVSLTVIVKVVSEGESLVGTKLEKNPPEERGWHGLPKLD